MDGQAVVTAMTERIRATAFLLDGQRRYVAEGDLVLDELELEEYVQRKAAALTNAEAAPKDQAFVDRGQRLLVATRGGRIVRWQDGLTLTYSVASEGFSRAKYDLVRDNLRAASRAWEGVCGIRFRDVSVPHGEIPSDHDAAPVFRVEAIDTEGGFVARAFLPGDAPDRRVLLIDDTYFSPRVPFNLIGVLRHELGHVLGFRHEHVRHSGWSNCRPEPLIDTEPLTEYDPTSVMHYLCEGMGSPQLELTSVDEEGARAVYGPPLSKFELVS